MIGWIPRCYVTIAGVMAMVAAARPGYIGRSHRYSQGEVLPSAPYFVGEKE